MLAWPELLGSLPRRLHDSQVFALILTCLPGTRKNGRNSFNIQVLAIFSVHGVSEFFLRKHLDKRFWQPRWVSGYSPSLSMSGEAGAESKRRKFEIGRTKKYAGSERVEKEKGDARSRTDLFPSCPSNGSGVVGRYLQL